MSYRLAFLLLCLFATGNAVSSGQRPSGDRAALATDVRTLARQLAFAWVHCAKPGAGIDEMAYRSIAFAGMVGDGSIELDGRRIGASQALVDSGLTLLKSGTVEQDAAAMRNTVYALMEIAEGRVFRASR